MNILAIDTATVTGWAYSGHLGVFSGTKSFKPKRGDSDGLRFLNFYRWLSELADMDDVDIVYFEDIRRHVSTASAHMFGGFRAVLMMWCEENKIAFTSVVPTEWKKQIIGHGHAKKEQIIDWAKSKGYEPADDNEADALAILHYAMSVTNA